MSLEVSRMTIGGPASAPRCRRFDAPGRRLCVGLVALAGTLSMLAVPAHAAPPMFSLSGSVCDRFTGQPLAGATVAIGSREVQTDRAGAFHVAAPAASHYYTQASAPGHQATGFIVLSNPSGGPLIGAASFSFCGGLGLADAYRSADGGVRLDPFTLVRPAGTPVVISGTAIEPLEGEVALQRPDGAVDLISMQRRGRDIRVPLHFGAGVGRYVLEINAAAGFALLKIPICIGRYQPPAAPPDYMVDQPGAGEAQLQAAAMAQINAQRLAARLRALAADPRLAREAQAHSDDIVARNYMLQHAHVGSDGSSPADRIRAAGVSFQAMAEDIGNGGSVQEIMLDLMDSPAHRWAILGNFTRAGVGITRQGSALTLTIDFVR